MHAPNNATHIGKNHGNAADISLKAESIANGLVAIDVGDTPKTVQPPVNALLAAPTMVDAVREAGMSLQISSAFAP